MTLRSTIVTIASCAASLLLWAGNARAITLPDSSTCGSTGYCLRIKNNGGGWGIEGLSDSGDGVFGQSAGSRAYGVYGLGERYGVGGYGATVGVQGVSTDGAGVSGHSTSGIGIRAESNTGNGLVATNNNSGWEAAAVSALSADATNGLAYWGTGSIIVTGEAYKPGGGSWQVYSDARLKRDVTSLRLGLDQLRQVRPVTYKYNGLGSTTDTGREYVGVIAQELEKIFPGMVTSRKGKLHPSDAAETDIKIVDPSALTFVLINSVKEQQQIIDRQERRIAALESGRGLSASMFGTSAVEVGLAFSLLPLGFVALRRRKASKVAA